MSPLPFEAHRLAVSIRDLPSLPGLTGEALRILDDPHSSAVEIESVLLRDQTMSAKVLRVVNSAAYGFGRRIGTIREAVTLLGLRKTRGVVGAMAASGLYAKGIDGLVDPRELWAHSLATSVWAMEIIEYHKIWGAQSSVTAALLHDIGIVMLCQYAEDRYRSILEKSRCDGIHHEIVEQQELHTTHAFIGATLCAKWMLPVSITQLVNGHHSNSPPSDEALGVVMLADHLAYFAGIKPFSWSADPAMPTGLLDCLRLKNGDLSALKKQSPMVQSRAEILFEAARS